MNKLCTTILLILVTSGSSLVSALPITFSQSSGIGGNGGSTFNINFTLGTEVDPTSVLIDIALRTYDQNFIIDVNGSEVVPVDNNNPAIFNPGIASPWNANSNGLARLIISLNASGVSFEGTTSSSSNSLVAATYNQSVVTPVYNVGVNTIVLTNPDANGPDGINWSITGSYETVPAPVTLALFGLGLAGLGWSRRKKG